MLWASVAASHNFNTICSSQQYYKLLVFYPQVTQFIVPIDCIYSLCVHLSDYVGVSFEEGLHISRVLMCVLVCVETVDG